MSGEEESGGDEEDMIRVLRNEEEVEWEGVQREVTRGFEE